MRSFQADDGHVIIQLHPGDKALESIQDAIDEHEIDSGVVVSGIGGLRQLNVHYIVGYPEFPDPPADDSDIDEVIEDEGAWEIGSLQGAIANGEPHLHITAFEADEDRTITGHLEEGSIVHTLMEIVIRPIEGVELERRPEDMGIPMLQER